jgi:biotin carboxyl carrier protein|tara:strand:+ start:204 stop:641 length:438 start_codon:yes stop_codon:yes gene_type:complete
MLMSKKLQVRIGDHWYSVEVQDLDSDPVQVLVDGELVEVDLGRIPNGDPPGTPAAIDPVDGPAEPTPSPARAPAVVKVFHSPMPGVIMSVSVKEGDQVVTGDEICVLEAMKMQQSLRAEWSGIVRTVHVQPGRQVLDGDPIIELE